jgi:hypothetical protein
MSKPTKAAVTATLSMLVHRFSDCPVIDDTTSQQAVYRSDEHLRRSSGENGDAVMRSCDLSNITIVTRISHSSHIRAFQTISVRLQFNALFNQACASMLHPHTRSTESENVIGKLVHLNGFESASR